MQVGRKRCDQKDCKQAQRQPARAAPCDQHHGQCGEEKRGEFHVCPRFTDMLRSYHGDCDGAVQACAFEAGQTPEISLSVARLSTMMEPKLPPRSRAPQ